MTKQLLWTRWT